MDNNNNAVGIVAIIAIVVLVLAVGWFWLNRDTSIETESGQSGANINVTIPEGSDVQDFTDTDSTPPPAEEI